MNHLMRRLRTLVVPLAVTAAVLTGCGADEDAPAPSGVAAESDHNDADVAFATDMIPHQAQALVMTDMAVGRQLDQELVVVVDNIRAAQAPEIELMADWLQEWVEPVPETVRDHAHGGHDGEAPEMEGMEGMMSAEQLAELEDASGPEFEELWLTMMIEHHEGAVAMAETELESGSFQPALDLAEEIASSQTEEIEQMRAMLEE